MKFEPLKGKLEVMYEQGEMIVGDEVFTKDDVKSAVDWLKEQLRLDQPISIDKLINKAFEDVVDSE